MINTILCTKVEEERQSRLPWEATLNFGWWVRLSYQTWKDGHCRQGGQLGQRLRDGQSWCLSGTPNALGGLKPRVHSSGRQGPAAVLSAYKTFLLLLGEVLLSPHTTLGYLRGYEIGEGDRTKLLHWPFVWPQASHYSLSVSSSIKWI